MFHPMDPQTNQNLRARRGGESTLHALLYGLAASFMAGGLVLTGAPPGVRWGMFLIGCALVVAGNDLGHGQTAGGQEGQHPRPPKHDADRGIRGRSGRAVQRGDRPARDALERAGGPPGVQRAAADVAEQP